MALSKTHILVTWLAFHLHDEIHFNVRDIIPYAVLPDAIRCFNFGENVKNNRVISHFEKNPTTGSASWMVYPSKAEIKVLDDRIVQSLGMHIEPDYNQVAIGDETSMGSFIEHNNMLESEVLLGVYLHLIQDVIYDEYVRQKINCYRRRIDGTFSFKGEVYDAKSVRKLISEIEEQEFRLLAKKFERITGEKPDQAWFERTIKPLLDEAYSPKMAECTWKYILVNLEGEYPKHLQDEECEYIINRMVRLSEKCLNF